MKIFRIVGAHAAYKKKEVVRGIYLSVRQGQTVAVIGPNGAGKSTLLRIVAGFLEPVKGHILIDDRDVNKLAPHQRARLGVGYLMQGGRVFSSLTVKENLELAASRLATGVRQESIREITEMMDLGVALGARVGILSGGWRQRLALAMLLVTRPSILLLDEPSAGLAPISMQSIFNALDQYRQTHQTAILLVEQNVQVALSFAHRAVVLVNGKIVDETKHPETWLAEGKLDSLFLGHTSEPLLWA